MSVTKTFPLSTARIDNAKYGEEQSDPALRAKMEGGYVVTRPRHTRRPRRTWKIGFTDIRDADKTALQVFWDSVRGGSEAFNWTVPVSNEAVVVRFAEGNRMSFEYAGPILIDEAVAGRWNVSDITLEEI